MEMAGLSAFGLTGTFFGVGTEKRKPPVCPFDSSGHRCPSLFADLQSMGELLDMLRQMAEQAGVAEGYFGIVLKVIGIAYLSQFASQLCADAGEGAVAAKIELAGKVLIMAISIPVLTEVLHVVLTLV